MEKFLYAPEIAKLGHVALVSEDLEKSLVFFRDTIGLEVTEVVDGVHYLRAWGDFEHHTLSIAQGETSYIDHIGWRTKRPEDVATFARLLEDAGTDIRWVQAGEEVAQGEAVRFELPSGHRFELYYDMDKTPGDESRKSVLKNQTYKSWAKGVSPRRIDHVNLQTSHDNTEIVNYLKEALGFKLREYFVNPDDIPVASWLSVTNLVHDVAIMSTPRSKEPNEMHHIAYWLDNSQDLLRAADILCEAEVPFVGPGKHGISQAMYIYVKDPGSGLRLEIFTNSYLIFEPDWEPIKWTYEEYLKNGSSYWGDRRRDDVDREAQVKELAKS